MDPDSGTIRSKNFIDYRFNRRVMECADEMLHEEESWFRNGGLSTSYSIQNSALKTDGVNAASRDEACIASGVCPAEAEVRTLSQSRTFETWGCEEPLRGGRFMWCFPKWIQMVALNGPLSIRISPSCVQTFSCVVERNVALLGRNRLQPSPNLLWQVKPRASCRRSHRCCKCSCNSRNPLS